MKHSVLLTLKSRRSFHQLVYLCPQIKSPSLFTWQYGKLADGITRKQVILPISGNAGITWKGERFDSNIHLVISRLLSV